MAGKGWKIEYTRSGGFAGMARSVVVDSAQLDPDEAREWDKLVAHLDVESVRGVRSQPTGPDRFQHDVVIHRGGKRQRFTVHDGAMPPDAQPLIERLEQRLQAG